MEHRLPSLTDLNTYTLNITLYDLFFFGMICIGSAFAMLLGLVKNVNRSANRFLALAMVAMILWMIRILAINIRLETYLAGWDRLPTRFLLALGPLIYFYVLKITRPDYKFGWPDLWHFTPLLLEQFALGLEIRESIRTGAATYATQIFRQLNPVLQLLIFISIISYLYRSHQLIQNFYRRLQPILMDRSQLEFRWLRRLLVATALLWLSWIIYAVVDYFGYHNQSGVHIYYLFYIFFVAIIIWTATAAFLNPQAGIMVHTAAAAKPVLPTELRAKGTWLKKAVEAHLYYQDPELNLSSLAEKLDLSPHQLSRIINTALNKSFADFINEYRIREVARKMQNPAYDQYTLLGIAYDSGFNSKTNFNRAFRGLTGKSPAEYKSQLNKERPFYNTDPRPRFASVISYRDTTTKWSEKKLNRNYMFRNYLKVAWRNLTRNKVSSFINIGGLAIGMAVTMLIGLWIWDELSFDKNLQHYDRIAQVMQNQTFNGSVNTSKGQPIPLGAELRASYGNDFKHVVLSSWSMNSLIAAGDKKFNIQGNYMQAEAPDMLSLHMLQGSRSSLKEHSTVLLSHTMARKLFGDANPIGKIVKLNVDLVETVTGVYEDFPLNCSFSEVAFIAPFFDLTSWTKGNENNWGSNSFQVFVQIADHADMSGVSAKIENAKLKRVGKDEAKLNGKLFLHPMSKWHLYSEFKNGVNTGGSIQYVWLFGIIAFFVLLLACINFMNLSTARSEKRAKEVGIRKAVGSLRQQLISQFFMESLLAALLSFALCLVLVLLILPFFNQISGKQMSVLWGNPYFWFTGIGFSIVTGLISGSYPALYLSSFNPVKVLKGTFKAGRFASLPRKVLVVIQFSVSVILIVGTVVVFRQVQFAKDRPIGYSREGLITVLMQTANYHDHFAAVRNDLLKSGAVAEIAESNTPITENDRFDNSFEWRGKDPNIKSTFNIIGVTTEYGKTTGWHLESGRDFSTKFLSDSSGIILNQAAVKYMGLKNPVGETIKWNGGSFTVIGVVNDLVMESPYEPVKPSVFYIDKSIGGILNIRLSPNMNAAQALGKIETIGKQYSPDETFDYKFADQEYAFKFANEERVGKLAGYFTFLAIFISCIGLFGMASFMAEQKVKEIGIRKVVGASVFSLWRLMSTEFVMLVLVSLLIGIPLAYSCMHHWLQSYVYHTPLSWWIFAATAAFTILITLVTVSFQSIKAAMMNPVKSLRSE